MKVALLVALASCVVPAQQPSYYQSPPGQPQQPQMQPPPNAYAASAPPAASCKDTLQCYTQCNPFTQQCVTACDQRTTPDAMQSAHAVLQCMSGCGDQNCVAQRCGPQIQACTNMTLASAAPPPSSSPSASGPDPVMQPEYYAGGTLKIPPPRRMLVQSDLVGDWSNGDTAISSYATSNGQYAGFRGVSTSIAWSIDAQGNFREAFNGAYTGMGGPRGVSENSTGTVTVNNNNTVSFHYPPQNGNQANTDNFIITGWFVGPDAIFLKLQGPFRAITQQELDNVEGNRIYDKTFVKHR